MASRGALDDLGVSAAVTTQVRARWSDESLLGSLCFWPGRSGMAALMPGHTNQELRLQERAEGLTESLGLQRDVQGSVTAVFA